MSALFVRWLEGAAICGACEGEELVETVTEAAECAVGAIDCAVGVASFASVGIVLADDLLGNFHESVKDVAETTAELAGGGVLVSPEAPGYQRLRSL